MDTITTFWEQLKKGFVEYLPDFIGALIIAAVGLLVAFIAVRITRKAMTRKNADASLIAFVCRAVRIIIYIITLFAALSALKISVTGLVAFFSAAAAAVALALKDKLSDLVGGIVILFTKPFVTGDFIEFGSYKGFVQKIDIMHTVLLTYDDTNVIVPNSVISASQVNNYTAHPQVRVQVDVPIPYEADIDKVKEILFGVLNTTELVLRDEKHAPTVRLERFGDSSLDFVTRCYCNFNDYWTVYYALTESIKKALDSNGISIPFNQLDVHLIK